MKRRRVDMEVNYIHEMKEELAKQLIELQQQSYRIEANLINYPNIPPLNETVADLLREPKTWLTASSDNHIIGAIAIETRADHWLLNKVIVSPRFFRRGVGRMLIQKVKEETSVPLYVTTASHNTPAVKLYESEGFTQFKHERTTDGLLLRTFVYRKEPGP